MPNTAIPPTPPGFEPWTLANALVGDDGGGGLTLTPQNTAAIFVEPAVFQCASSRAPTLDWKGSSDDGQTQVDIVTNCEVNENHTKAYGLVNVGPGRCDLLIKAVTNESLKVYTCVEGGGYSDEASAQLIILGES